MRRLVCLVTFLVGMVAVPGSVRADEYHWAFIFGSQSHPKVLRRCHTWATFLKAVGEGPDLSTYQFSQHTISWYPADFTVQVWAVRPEAGVNLTLEQTIGVVRSKGENITSGGRS